jgi:hypothetical protein
MEVSTISNIRLYRNNIRQRLSTLDKNKFGEQRFGQEQEYSYREMLAEIESLLVDVSAFTKAPRRFIRCSNYAERNNLANILNTIHARLEQPNDLLPQVDSLKIFLRHFHALFKNEKASEISGIVHEITEKKHELELTLRQVATLQESVAAVLKSSENDYKGIVSNKEKAEAQISHINKTEGEILVELKKANDSAIKITQLRAEAEEKAKHIQDSLNESKSSEKLISSFSKKVQENDKRLEGAEKAIDSYNLKLEEFTKERTGLLKEAEDLIESAREALGYKTAEGLSASFQEQYQVAKDSGKGWWLFGSVIALLTAIGLGVWVAFDETTSLALVIGRIGLLPFPIIAAVFCAQQYVKSKNIQEDYAYKMVLAKAMVGFSEQIKEHGSQNNEEYLHYMKKVLDEIHRDPLGRVFNAKNEPKEGTQNISLDKLDRLIDTLEKMAKIKTL